MQVTVITICVCLHCICGGEGPVCMKRSASSGCDRTLPSATSICQLFGLPPVVALNAGKLVPASKPKPFVSTRVSNSSHLPRACCRFGLGATSSLPRRSEFSCPELGRRGGVDQESPIGDDVGLQQEVKPFFLVPDNSFQESHSECPCSEPLSLPAALYPVSVSRTWQD